MPNAYSAEFRSAVVRAARASTGPQSHVARAFGVSPSCLYRWLRFEDRAEFGPTPSAGLHPADGTPRWDPGELLARLDESGVRLARLERDNRLLRLVIDDLAAGGDEVELFPLVVRLAEADMPEAEACALLRLSPHAFRQWRRDQAAQSTRSSAAPTTAAASMP